MIKLSTQDVIDIHNVVIELTGGSNELRSYSLLESAVLSTYQTFDNTDIYSSIEEKASHLIYSIIKNHPFVDGNKRTGIQSGITLLIINNLYVNCSDSDIQNIAYSVASGDKDYDDILEWIYKYTK